MIAALGHMRPRRAPLGEKVRGLLDIVLHIGAHRTATSSLQHWLRGQGPALRDQGVAVWDPRVTRPDLVSGVQPGPLRTPALRARAAGRLRLKCAQAGLDGVQTLILSDENMLGSPLANVAARALYPAAGERMARIGAALRGQVTRVVLSVRGLDAYWASVLAMTVARGHRVPGPRHLAALAGNRRGWRDVITDVACALPEARLIVLPHEQFASMPEARLEAMAQRPLTLPQTRDWLNRAPDLAELRRIVTARGQNPAILPDGQGRWTPFDAGQTAALRETYADDLHWLMAGAEGLADLKTWTAPAKTGQTPHSGAMTRGHTHEQQGRLA